MCYGGLITIYQCVGVYRFVEIWHWYVKIQQWYGGFPTNMWFYYFCLLLLNNDTTHEASNLKTCYVLSHISPMENQVIIDQISALLLPMTLMLCLLITSAMREFLEMTLKWLDAQLSKWNHIWHIVTNHDGMRP